MKQANRDTVRFQLTIIQELEASGQKKPDDPLGPKYLTTLPYKFGGKKRSPSNSGGKGRAARRIKRVVR